MLTNRDIYLAINELAGKPVGADRSLEEYLRALLPALREHRNSTGLSGEEFLAVLRRAFVDEPLAYEKSWAKLSRNGPSKLEGFAFCEAVLLEQIVDLHEMRKKGILDDEGIELGVKSPRGAHWFNFHPRQYLECATDGSMGGWEPGDPGGRNFVPGLVTVQDAEGNFVSVDPKSVDRPIFPVAQISWDQFADFLHCGQTYE